MHTPPPNSAHVQDVCNLAEPGADHANVVCLLGPPGSGKSDLMLRATAEAQRRVDERAAAAGPQQPTPGAVKLLMHKASLALNIGPPAETNAVGLKFGQWQRAEGGRPAGYTPSGFTDVANHAWHFLEECQAWVSHLRQFCSRFLRAREQAGRPADGPSVLRDCPHVLSMDPLQSACKPHGVSGVSADGTVMYDEPRVTMPWQSLMNIFGRPCDRIHWHFIILQQHIYESHCFVTTVRPVRKRKRCCRAQRLVQRHQE